MELKLVGSKILEYAQTIEPCQRNWDESFVMPEDHIKYIIDVCTTVPTKQNRDYYSLLAIKERRLINEIYKYATVPEKLPPHGNTQARANLLLIWCTNDSILEISDGVTIKDVLLSVGISSSAAAMAAAEMGYKTGFCGCYLNDQTSFLLQDEGLTPTGNIQLILGIGVPNKNYDSRQVVVADKVYPKKNGHGKKNINVRIV